MRAEFSVLGRGKKNGRMLRFQSTLSMLRFQSTKFSSLAFPAAFPSVAYPRQRLYSTHPVSWSVWNNVQNTPVPGQANLQSVSRARCEAVLRERLFRTVLRQLSSSAKPPRGQADARDDKDEGQSVRLDLHTNGRCNC